MQMQFLILDNVWNYFFKINVSVSLTQSIVLCKFQVILILFSFNFRDNIKNNKILD